MSLSVDRLESEFLDFLESLSVTPGVLRLTGAVVRDAYKRHIRQSEETRAGLERQIDKLRSQRERLVQAFVYEQKIDQDTYDAQKRRLDAEILAVEQQVEAARPRPVDVENSLARAWAL